MTITVPPNVYPGQAFGISGVVNNYNTTYVLYGLTASPGTTPSQLFQAFVSSGAWSGTLVCSATTPYVWVQEYAKEEPLVYLSTSLDKGKSFGSKMAQSVGGQGEYLTAPSWRRLGMARDMVFKLTWSFPAKTALNGAFLDFVVMKS